MSNRSTDVPSPPQPRARAWTATAPGGWVSAYDHLLERTLASFGSYVSDDGHVTIRRAGGSAEYLAARFTGSCAPCSRARLIPPTGEPLSDSRAAARFVAAHRHGEVD